MAEELTPEIALENFGKAYEYKRKFLASAQEDAEFTLGKMWDDRDIEDLKSKGVRALTINKIRPNLFLLKGLESQNRSEFRAYPEGKEDEVTAEIATLLLKNVMKNCDGDYKVSEVFEDGNTVGESFIEPSLDYPYTSRSDGTVNINATMKLKKTDHCFLFPEAGFKEYDMSDAGYVCKVTYDVSKDQLLQMFPEKKSVINSMENGKLNVDGIFLPNAPGSNATQQGNPTNYKQDQSTNLSPWTNRSGFDLLDYYYKKWVEHYFIVDLKAGAVKQAANKQEADNYAKKATEGEPAGQETVKVIMRLCPEIWVGFMTGGMKDFLAHEKAWSFPRWNGWPFIPYYCYRSTLPLRDNNRDLAVQGITRIVKDLNRELNKRRTQELRHLNQSTNSGWLSVEDAWVDEDKVDKTGATAGISLKYKKGYEKPERIFPMPLSQGHSQLAQEHQQDMKEALGINTDLLALQEGGQSSGRAIALRQKQGIVMVQGMFDNLSRTKRLLGRFILTQLKTIYDVQGVIRVIGDAFISENFSQPVVDPRTGQPAINPQTKQPIIQVDQAGLIEKINSVLNDTEVGMYDVAVGENVSSETIQYGNYLTLSDLAKSGVPIPPEVLIEESQISEGAKKQILAAIQQANQQAILAQAAAGGKRAPAPAK